MKATITYDVVTPESAEHGEVSEHGFAAPGGWTFPMECVGQEAAAMKRDCELTAGEVLRWAADRGAWRDNGTGSFYCEQVEDNYETGAATSYAVHFDGVTAASLGRIARVLGAS